MTYSNPKAHTYPVCHSLKVLTFLVFMNLGLLQTSTIFIMPIQILHLQELVAISRKQQHCLITTIS